jgi:putative transposase
LTPIHDGINVGMVWEMVNKSWKQFLAVDAQESEMELFRKHERTGRPLRGDPFIDKVELLLNRRLRPQKPGLQKKDK